MPQSLPQSLPHDLPRNLPQKFAAEVLLELSQTSDLLEHDAIGGFTAIDFDRASMH